MTPIFPITLQGKNLGERHHYFNTLLSRAHKKYESLQTVLDAPESAPVDRLFKIELASKHKNVEYVLKNLRDDDMLYVSKALKSKWLLDDAYRDIINPNYLENVLYPEMITTAVNKMKHWIHLNLRDPKRCQEFYEYYAKADENIGIKFLLKCPKEFIENECVSLFKTMPSVYFKVMCERSPQIANIFFKAIDNNESLRLKYFKNKRKYFDGLKLVMKANVDLFLDIIEIIKWQFPRLSPQATKFIMKEKKIRFLKKQELYTANILHIETLAQYLKPEESEELVLKLARAKFLDKTFHEWFTYKNVDPFIKKMHHSKRADFKKRVFVEKDVGQEVNEWPYPVSEVESDCVNNDDNDSDVFEDYEESPEYYDFLATECNVHRRFVLCSRPCADKSSFKVVNKQKTLLDILFDEYRFKTFEESLFELRKKIAAESSPKNRMFILLVLISKTGGRIENLRKLCELLTEHRNEPAHVRAAVVRSLVKRAFIWRASDDVWESLLTFVDGLGLDGSRSPSDCEEGLHAVVIRSLLSTNDCKPAIETAFLNNFSTLKSYSLTPKERDIVIPNLVKLLLINAQNTDAYESHSVLMKLLDVFNTYDLKVDLEYITSIKILAERDIMATQNILRYMFRQKIARKELFLEYFGLIKTSGSYTNALKHNPSVLSAKDFTELIASKKINADNFLTKINIYFGEDGGLRHNFLVMIKNAKPVKNTNGLARALVTLLGNDLQNYITKLDSDETKESKQFSAQMRGQAHVARPALSLDSFEWRNLGAKLIANRVLLCRQVDVHRYIKQLLLWHRTAKIAIILAKRAQNEIETLAAVAELRPIAALKTGLSYIRRQGDDFDVEIWGIVKSLMAKVSCKSIQTSHYLKKTLKEVEKVPLQIKPEFIVGAYSILKKYNSIAAMPLLCHVKLLLPKFDEEFVTNILIHYVNCDFTPERISDRANERSIALLHLRILGKYLLLCKTEKCQKDRFNNIGLLYLKRLETYWETERNINMFRKYIKHLLKALKYTNVFLNVDYADCSIVMDKIEKWMQGILPVKIFFNYFMDLHLTLSYYRAIRKSVGQKPEVFSDKKRRLDEGAKIVGEAFGKYICHEAHELRHKYFDSVIELYGAQIQGYLSKYFDHNNQKFVLSIVKGLLTAAEDVESYLAINLFYNYHHFDAKYIEEVHDMIIQRKDITSQFLFHY